MNNNRITIIFTLLFSTLSLISFSQQFSFGPKVGVNFTNVAQHSTMSAGADAGLFFRVGESFYFQPEVCYSFKSSTFKDAFDELEENFDLKTHTLDIPLLFGYKFFNNPNFNFRIFIGPRLGVLIGSTVHNENSDLGKVQIGGQVGFGIDVWRFTIDLKYDYSGNKYNGTSENDTWFKQNMFNLALGFKIVK